MADWQPIETAPKDGTIILAWWKADDTPNNANHRLQKTRWGKEALGDPGEEGWIIGLGFPPIRYQPTHWMPLPPPPVQGE